MTASIDSSGGEAAVAAIEHVRSQSSANRVLDLERLGRAVGRHVDDRFVDETVQSIRSNCRLTLNFHPDRLGANRMSVAESLMRSGMYLPQFETGLSSGERSAVPGGRRTVWESQMFGGAYDHGDERRPCYGALDITGDPFGASPRFGSSFVVLKAHCLDRATFVVGDSHLGPRDIGTAGSFASILAGLFEGAVDGNGLGRGLSPTDVLHHLTQNEPPAASARELDEYIEAQIHGTISLHDDVAAIVLDPSFGDTPVHLALAAAASRYGFSLDWHAGLSLLAKDVPADYRGLKMPDLARRIVGENGILNAAAIGRSAAAIPFSPLSAAGDDPDSALQQHKYLWHCLLTFGS